MMVRETGVVHSQTYLWWCQVTSRRNDIHLYRRGVLDVRQIGFSGSEATKC